MIDADLSGRVALVTGSGRGLGRETALALADCGAAVAVHYRSSRAAADRVAERARDRGAPAATTVAGDVTDPDAVDALFDAVEDDLGPVDVLVNSVGDFAPVHWSDLAVSEYHRVMDTNLTATVLTCRRALPTMREAGDARIVNVGYASSDRALVSPKNFPYFVAKAGVLMFTRMLAADTRDDGITVNAVSPYVVENSDRFPEDLPRGRPARFEDVIGPILFFCHPDTDYVSGANVSVDGGWLPERV